MSAFNPKTQDHKLASKMIVALERISETFRVLLWEEAKKHQLSPIQIQLMIFLLYHPKEQRKVSYLAKEFNMTKATVSDSIRVLFKKELITKEKDPNDTRSYTIDLSPSGTAIAQQCSVFTNPIEKSIQQLSNDQQDLILDGLMHLINGLNSDGVITVQRMCRNCAQYRYTEGKHYCSLLELYLKTTELRVDCPEHSPKTAS